MATNIDNGSSVSRQAAPVHAGHHQMATTGDGPPPPRRVAFILYNLPFHSDDDFSVVHGGIHEELEDLSEKIAATYHQAMATVLGSSLNHAGMVRAVYLNIWQKGCFQFVNPQADFFQNVTPGAFESKLRELFSTHRIVDPLTNEETWREVPDILSNLPANKHIIGCVSGDASQNFTNFRDYITAASGDQTFVSVVGDFEGFEGEVLLGLINDYVKVSDYSLTAQAILSRMCIASEEKWNIWALFDKERFGIKRAFLINFRGLTTETVDWSVW
ncbi:uncharacterized protein [Euphorbia lathyris]|uniref:uncharacterized protein n=1 Tax=Euphorbia lathyris TaxID=212925 RepID=UPI003313124A